MRKNNKNHDICKENVFRRLLIFVFLNSFVQNFAILLCDILQNREFLRRNLAIFVEFPWKIGNSLKKLTILLIFLQNIEPWANVIQPSVEIVENYREFLYHLGLFLKENDEKLTEIIEFAGIFSQDAWNKFFPAPKRKELLVSQATFISLFSGLWGNSNSVIRFAKGWAPKSWNIFEFINKNTSFLKKWGEIHYNIQYFARKIIKTFVFLLVLLSFYEYFLNNLIVFFVFLKLMRKTFKYKYNIF